GGPERTPRQKNHLTVLTSIGVLRKNKGNRSMIELTDDRIRLSEAEARTLSEGAIAGIGYSREEVATIADHFVDAALCGYEYSGLPKLLDAVEDGRRLKPRSPMRLVRETNVSALFDGGNNLGMLTLSRLADV